MRWWWALPALVEVTGCAPKAPEADPPRLELGRRAFQKCYSCHDLSAGHSRQSGPSLHAVVDRPIASIQGFDYSPAMRRLALEERAWTRDLLDGFIADPEAVAPGTSMTFHGIGDPDERAALIAYLESDQTRASAASLP